MKKEEFKDLILSLDLAAMRFGRFGYCEHSTDSIVSKNDEMVLALLKARQKVFEAIDELFQEADNGNET